MHINMTPAVKPSDERQSTEIVAVARRRHFTASYKHRIVRAADVCTPPCGSVDAFHILIVGFYNSERINSVLGNLSPAVFKHNIAAKEPIAMSETT